MRSQLWPVLLIHHCDGCHQHSYRLPPARCACVSQDSWEDSIWAQPEPSPPEADGADHRGDEVKDGREWRRTVNLLGLPEAEYQTNNSVVKRAIHEALEQQGQNEVRLGKVQAYVLEALGVNLSKETLRPIVKFMLDKFAYERDRDAAEAIGQPITPEYLRRKHSSYMSWLTQPWGTEPSPFDGVTKITKHNAWRYAPYKPGLQRYKGKATRSPFSEPARFYRQLTGLEWDGESRSYDLACRAFRRLLPAYQHEEREREERRKQQRHDARLASALPSAVTSASKPTHTAPKPSATLTASSKPTHAAAQPLSSNVPGSVPGSVLGSVTAVDALMMGMPYDALGSSKDPKKTGGKSRNRRVDVQQHSKRQCTIPATAETTPSNAHQTTAATPTPLPALVSAAALSVAAESHTRACERVRVSHLLEQERGRWRKLYMTAALNAAFTAQPATTDPAAPEPMMSGAGLAESNGTASEAADEPADCDPGGGTLTEGTVCSDLSKDTYLPPECRHDEKHIRKFKDREDYHRAMADFFYQRICDYENNEWLEDQRREFNGETRITKDNEALFVSDAPSLRDYRDKAMRTRDSLPARFYRMVMGKEWDGEGHSYSLATKRYRRLNPDDPYQQKERERQQGKKRDYSKKKRPTDDNQRRQARRKAQREREKAAASMAV